MLNKKHLCLVALPFMFSLCGCERGSTPSSILNVADYVDKTGVIPCADKIQSLINDNPNRTLYFPDGTYLLDHQIATPGDPKKSVSLKLDDFAILKAAPDYISKREEEPKEWQDENLYMVSLGGLDRENRVIEVGANFSMIGGYVDGSGIACGVEIAGGREVHVENVNMKNVEVGLFIAKGVNSGSSDADVLSTNIICNDSQTSLGVKINGYDNTLTNMRIGHSHIGVQLNAGGNTLRNIHPLHNGDCLNNYYKDSIGFDIKSGRSVFDYCYSDNYETSFKFKGSNSSPFSNCVSWWFKSGISDKDKGTSNQIAIDGGDDTKEFKSNFYNLNIGFNTSTSVSSNPTFILMKNAAKGTGVEHTVRFHDNTINNYKDADKDAKELFESYSDNSY